MSSKKYGMPVRRSRRGLAWLLFLLVCTGLAAGILYERQAIYDWTRLRGYDPPAAVAQLATEDGMTPYARKVFYVNHPALENKAAFKQCTSSGEQTIVLGCYHGFQNGIFVLTVDDPRLEGVEQVTAAHEMLHAVYDRLSKKDRTEIDRQLRDYYEHGLQDERVRQTVDAYRSSEPNELTNEMHSIFGTEVADLPPALEKYYTRYFSDRRLVTSYAAQYQGEFTSRRDAIKAYDAQLTALKAQIESLEADLTARQKALDADSARLQQLRSSNVQAYNAAVPGYNASVNAYNAAAGQAKALISKYNQIVAARNAVAAETQQLTNEIDSKVTPITAQ